MVIVLVSVAAVTQDTVYFVYSETEFLIVCEVGIHFKPTYAMKVNLVFYKSSFIVMNFYLIKISSVLMSY